MRTVTYNGEHAAVVIGNVATFERGRPVDDIDDDVARALDPALWTVAPPFDTPTGDEPDTAPAPVSDPAEKENTHG